MDGLQELQVAEALKLFPDVFEPLFVGSAELCPEDVVGILHPKDQMIQSEEIVNKVYQRE